MQFISTFLFIFIVFSTYSADKYCGFQNFNFFESKLNVLKKAREEFLIEREKKFAESFEFESKLELNIGDTIGEYNITRYIGHGEFAAIYEVVSLKSKQRFTLKYYHKVKFKHYNPIIDELKLFEELSDNGWNTLTSHDSNYDEMYIVFKYRELLPINVLRKPHQYGVAKDSNFYSAIISEYESIARFLGVPHEVAVDINTGEFVVYDPR